MQQLVFLELTVVEEGLSTAVTHEAFLLSVDLHVSLQGPGPGEALPTFITPERLISCMQPEMSLIVVLESKAHGADAAAEGLLFRVDESVLDQAHLTLEGFSTLTALVGALF